MKKTFITAAIILTFGAIECVAQSNAAVQPIPASRDAVLAPAAEITPADSNAVQVDVHRDAAPSPTGAAEVPADNSGQPAPSVRKPD